MMNRKRRGFIVSATILLLVVLISYGPYLYNLGYYWDDWSQLLNRHMYGSGSYWQYFSERPFSGWTHILYSPIMGDHAWQWQTLGLMLRWMSATTLGFLSWKMWPKYQVQAFMVAAVFCVLPSFSQQPISVAYSQHWTQYLLFLLSLLFMVLGSGKHKRYGLFLILSLLTQIGQLSITEFFLGVELVRPVLIWLQISAERFEPGQMRWLVLKKWSPYLIFPVCAIIWRVWIQGFSIGEQKEPVFFRNFEDQPIASMVRLLRHVAADMGDITFGTLTRMFDLQLNNLTPGNLAALGVMGVITILLATYSYKVLIVANKEPEPSHWWRPVLPLGMFVMLLGFLPLWALDEAMHTLPDPYHADRFTLPGLFGASFLAAGLIDWVATGYKKKLILMAFLVGLMANFQVRNSNDYRWLSIEQERFFQQLAFRIPSIKEGTTLLTEDILFPSHGIFPTASAINLLYLSGPAESRVIPVWMYSLYPRLADRSPTAGPVSFHTNFRVWNFDGISTKALLLQYGLEKQNCLWVLSPNDHDNPDLPPLTRRWLSVSDLNRIDPTSPDGWVFNPQLFGEPSLKSWCYYFENADLARQTENWEAGADLADNALDAGFSISASGSNNPFEWLPFMEAYAQKGRWQDAARIAIEGYNWDPDYQEMLCNRWQGWLAIDTNPTDKENATLQVQETLGCTFLP